MTRINHNDFIVPAQGLFGASAPTDQNAAPAKNISASQLPERGQGASPRAAARFFIGTGRW